LDEALKTGRIDSRSSLANYLRKKLTPGQKEDLKKMTSEAQKTFRMEFARTQMGSFTSSKSHTKSWRRIDTQKGHYLNLDQLIRKEEAGDSEKGMAGVRLLIQQAVALGPPWIRVHPQTNRTLFLVLDFQFSEDFETSWAMLKCEHENQALKIDPIQNKPEETAPMKAVLDTQIPKEKAKAKAKTAPEAKAAARDEKKEVSKAKKEFEQQWKEIQKLKNYVMKVTSSAIELNEQINEAEDWRWAKNEGNQGELNRLLRAVKSRYSDFHRRLITEDSAMLKRHYGDEFLVAEMKTFNALKPEVEKLSATVEKMKKRHVQ
jgi:hypothetical protein